MKIVPLAPGAEKKSYYKYIHEPLALLSDEKVKSLKTLRDDPANTLEFADRHEILTPDFVPRASGCYMLKTGGLLVSSTVEVPDITKEMMDWWMVWHQFDHLRYALWDPRDHYDVKVTPETRARLLDESKPYIERLWGTPSYVLESFNGEKPENTTICFCDPAELGYDKSVLGTENCYSMICTKDIVKKGPFTFPVVMTEILRKGPNGKNIWVANWWLGCTREGDADVAGKMPVRKFIAKMVSALAVHNQIEMPHLNKVLPKLYAEYKDKNLEDEV